MRRKILVVEDNEVNRLLLKKMLSDEYDVLEAKNGRLALEILSESYESISAVLLDIVMPVMGGYEVLEHMNADPKLCQIPVIVTTGNTELGAEVRALSRGAQDFVVKPYDPAVLRHRLWNTIKLRESAALANMTTKDSLTGLFNRETFFRKAAEMIDAKEAGYYVMACFDIDNFKVVNDRYGTAKGDAVLKQVADIFRSGFDAIGGICCRITADNYAVLYPRSYMDSELVASIRAKAAVPDRDIMPISFSIGRYIIDDKSLTLSAMYDRASIAENSIKGRADVDVALYDEAMRDEILRQQEIAGEMRSALAKGQFEAWYQPQYNHATGALIGAEALVRWRHPEKGIVPPADFIPIFERNGFIYEMDKYIWEQICIQLRARLDNGCAPLPVSVNVSRYDVLRADFYEIITGLVERYGIPKELFCLEITESAFAKSAEQIIAVVQRLLAYGLVIEIDDFGSGYSSLNILKDVPANILKLDMCFLESKDENMRRGGSIVQSVVRMARWLGMSIIAEGVETAEQADYLKSIGCSYVQGYLYAKPMPRADYERLIERSGVERIQSALKTVMQDNDAFWDPNSMETLIFNSYVGGACIFEYSDGRLEMLRINQKYAQELLGDGASMQDALEIKLTEHMSAENYRILLDCIRSACDTKEETICEIPMFGLREGGPRYTYIRSTMRIIARAGERSLLYNTIINMTEQREAEQKAKASYREMLLVTLAAMMESASDLSFVKDGSLRYLSCSRPFAKMVGLDNPADIVDKSDYDLFDEELADKYRADDLKLIENGKSLVDYIEALPSEDGTVRFSSTSKFLLHDSAGAVIGLYGTGRDVTQQHRNEELLRVSEEEMSLAMSQMGKMICLYDVPTRTLTLPEAYAKRYALPSVIADIPPKQPRYNVFDSENFEEFSKFYTMIVNGEKSGSREVKMTCADGTVTWNSVEFVSIFSKDGTPLRAIVSVEDVTSRHRREIEFKAIRDSEQIWQLVLQHSNRLIYRYDIATKCAHKDTIAATANSAAWSGVMAVDTNLPDSAIEKGVVLPESVEDYRRMFREISAGQESGGVKLHMSADDGSARWVDMKYSTLTGEDGKPKYAVLSFLDITADHEKELAFERYRQTVSGVSAEERMLYFDADLTSDVVERCGGSVPSVSFPGVGCRHNEMARYGINLMSEDDRMRAWDFFAREHLLTEFAKGVRNLSEEWRICLPDGEQRWFSSNIQLIEDPYSEHIRAYTSLHDITESKRAELTVRKQAELDGMTEIYNKSTTEQLIRERLSHGGVPCAFLIADLDNLKSVNDTFGHAQGDKAIRFMAETLRSQFRQTDIVGRIGGDEFVAFLEGTDNEAKLRSKMITFIKRLSEMRIGDKGDTSLHCSIGAARGVSGSDTYEELFQRADRALYQVKRNGKGSYALYAPEMEQEDYQYNKHQESAFLQAGLFDNGELSRLLGAVAELYPLVVSVNLTRNTYYMMQYSDFFTTSCVDSGEFDALIAEAVKTFHPQDRQAFADVLSRESLLRAYAEGKKAVSHEGRQLGDDGAYRMVHTDVVFMKDPENGDILEVSLSRECRRSGE